MCSFLGGTEYVLRNKLLLVLVSLGGWACSGGGGSSPEVTTPTPTPSNNAPVVGTVIPDQSAFLGYDFSFDVTQAGASFSDSDGDSLSYSATFTPANSGLSFAGNSVSGTPNQSGSIEVNVTASDGNGGSVSDSFDIDVSIKQSAIQTAFNGAIDLENLENYAGQNVPNYIGKLDDGGNPITDAGATLGRVLFYDVALSSNDSVSCASCHEQALAFGDAGVTSTGLDGGLTGRHSMRLINTQFADERQFFWDERAESHEAQESQPIHDEVEMGFSGINGQPNFTEVLTKIEALEYYDELFRFVYHDDQVTEERIQDAIAQFVKSIQSFDSKYDEGRAQVNNNNADFPNFTADENAGKTLFTNAPNNDGAGCNACHRAPEFDIAPNSDSNGIVAVANSPGEFDFDSTRAPTLRDIVNSSGGSNGPFMHDGSLATLRDVVDHYDAIPLPADEPERSQVLAAIDNRLTRNNGNNTQRLNLTETEKNQLVAFLQTLSGSSIYTDEKLSDPFP